MLSLLLKQIGSGSPGMLGFVPIRLDWSKVKTMFVGLANSEQFGPFYTYLLSLFV